MKYGGARYKRRSLRVLPRVKRIEETIPVGFGSLGIQGATPITFINGDPITDQQLRDFGYILAIDYGVDSANADNYTQFIDWIDEIKSTNKPGYLHYSADPYMTSGPVTCIHRVSYQGGTGPFERVQLEGGKNPATGTGGPEIKLADNAAGYESASDIKPLLYWQAVKPITPPADLYEVPDNPYDFPNNWEDDTGNLYSGYLRNINFNTGTGNAGAVGVTMPGAQRCYMADVVVDATGSACGISCFPATSFPSMNIEVIGGDIGVQLVTPAEFSNIDSAAGELIIGLKISGATIPLKSDGISCPATIVGFEIESAGTVYTQSSSAGTSNCLLLIDGRVTITGAGPAFDNQQGKPMYLRNVYVTGTDSLIVSSSGTVAETGIWKRINEYVFNDQRATSGDFVTSASSLIDGIASTATEPSTIITSGAVDPTSAIRTRHISVIPTVDDGTAFIDAVAEYGADNSSAADSRAAIQAAIDAAAAAGHNRVFLRGGDFYVGEATAGGYSLKLGVDSTFFGLFPGTSSTTGTQASGTLLRPHSSWLPTSQAYFIETTDSAIGSPTLSTVGFYMPYSNTGGSEVPPVPPTNEWFGIVRVKTKNMFTWGICSSDESRPSDDAPTNPRHVYHVEGNGGGQFYGMGLNNKRWGNPDARGVYITGVDTGPCLFYGHNFEVTKSGGGSSEREMTTSCEIVGASNVAIFSQKKEGRSGCIEVTDGNNVAFFGGGVLDSYFPDYHAFYGDSSNLLVAAGLRRRNDQVLTAMIREDLTATAEFTIGNENVSVYKRGDFSMDAMFGTPAPTYAALPIIPGGVFDGYESTITNPDARWTVLTTAALGGTFNFYAGGAWSYTRGTGTGTASFTWSLIDYDGLGNSATATHSFLVS